MVFRFAYTDEVKLEMTLEALQMYIACKIFDISSLLNISMKYMEDNLSSEDIWFVMDNLQELSDAQQARILKKADQVCHTPSFYLNRIYLSWNRDCSSHYLNLYIKGTAVN